MSGCGNKSFVTWYPGADRHLCGYCKNRTGNICHGMWADCLTVEDYQNLIDRGWRRSGHYCYKPIMDQVCCPMYTIKCDALNFSLSKSQKKVIKKFNKFIKDGVLHKREPSQDNQDVDIVPDYTFRKPHQKVNRTILELDGKSKMLCVEGCDNVDGLISSQKAETANVESCSLNESEVLGSIASAGLNAQAKSGIGADPNKPPCKKAKLLRLERKQEKLRKKGLVLETNTDARNEQKSLEEFLNPPLAESKHKLRLEVRSTNSKSEEWEQIKEIEFALYRRYQMSIHNDPFEKNTMKSFQRFLVSSPLQHVQFSKDSELGFGSFHQLYWLDDKLIAVGVIDILPKCISAVYFFYDPDYRDLTLGTYGSLREVEFARQLHQQVSSVKYYYMGYYIHSCPKMRYKGKLSPSFLLCPETYHWVSINKCIEKLEVSKYARFVDSDEIVDQNNCLDQDIDNIKIVLNNRLVTFKFFKSSCEIESLFKLIGLLIGRKCAKSLIFAVDDL